MRCKQHSHWTKFPVSRFSSHPYSHDTRRVGDSLLRPGIDDHRRVLLVDHKLTKCLLHINHTANPPSKIQNPGEAEGTGSLKAEGGRRENSQERTPTYCRQ